jgi:hypothetical protein
MKRSCQSKTFARSFLSNMKLFRSLSSSYPVLASFLLPFAFALTAEASESATCPIRTLPTEQGIQENWFLDHLPTEYEVPPLNQGLREKSPTPRLVIQAGDPSEHELVPLLSVGLETNCGPAAAPQLEVTRFPLWDVAPTLGQLARKGFELVVFESHLPTLEEVAVLNQAKFSKVRLITTAYPGIEDAERLSLVESPLELIFAVRAYPRFIDRDGLRAIPSKVPLTISTDYWPSYTHMDVLNMLAHPLKLRIRNSFPTRDSLPYLFGLKNLMELSLETDIDPAPGMDSPWVQLEKLPLRWISRGFVPSEESLTAFFLDSSRQSPERRRLVVDRDTPLFDSERSRLLRYRDQVAWTHAWGAHHRHSPCIDQDSPQTRPQRGERPSRIRIYGAGARRAPRPWAGRLQGT